MRGMTARPRSESAARGSGRTALRGGGPPHHLHRRQALRGPPGDLRGGVDQECRKHVLGISEGATENAVVVKELLEDLVARGVTPGRKRLFVIDGSKALRAGIDAV